MKITIYWKTRDTGIIDRIREKFCIVHGMTVNGENIIDVDDEDMPLLEECEQRGFIQIRRKK